VIDLATGLTGFALLVVRDLRGHRPLRALGVVLIGIAIMAVVAHLCSRRGGARDRARQPAAVGMGDVRAYCVS
jgi:hypothetical protein